MENLNTSSPEQPSEQPPETVKKQKPKSYLVGGSWFKRKKGLILMKKDFTITKTSSSVSIREKGVGNSGDKTYIYMLSGGNSSIVKFSELNLRRQIKSHVLKNIEGVELPELDQKNINYTRIADWVENEKHGAHLGDIVCYDINMAYYQCALILGFITKEFYERCLNLPKPVRLRLIGSIATKKRRYTYVGGKMTTEPEIIEIKKLRDVWHHIVNHVGQCMEEIAKVAGNKFLMYWVDGIYLRGKKEDWDQLMLEVSARWGFSFKYERIVDAIYQYDEKLKSSRLLLYKHKGDEELKEEERVRKRKEKANSRLIRMQQRLQQQQGGENSEPMPIEAIEDIEESDVYFNENDVLEERHPLFIETKSDEATPNLEPETEPKPEEDKYKNTKAKPFYLKKKREWDNWFE
jgi:hypothetical protein